MIERQGCLLWRFFREESGCVMKEKCIFCDCNKSDKKSLQNLVISPFEEGTVETKKLFSYFLYNAPNIESAHARQIDVSLHSNIFNKMIEGRHFEYKKFCWANAVIEDELCKGYLNGNVICLKCKRFVCKKKKSKKGVREETDFECFLRHIRNSIAHGRVYYSHAGNKIHIVFEDKNSSGKLSARIVCIKADLEYWKKVLSDNRYY